MKEEISKYIIIIILFFNNIIILFDLYEIRNKINEMEKRNLQVHEYILDRIETK